MRKLHYEVRQPTLDELDSAITRARDRMVQLLDAGDGVLAGVAEAAMNRLLDVRVKRIGDSAST